jgi:hypothetical protein
MQKQEGHTTDFLRKLGTVDTIAAQAKTDPALPEIAFNSHIHLPPNFSAFETVDQAVSLAAEQGISVLGVGNYYDFSVYETFAQLARDNGIFPSFGTEIIALETDLQQQNIRINDPGNPGKYYICGKAITQFEAFTERAAELNTRIRKNDTLRMQQMAQLLDHHFVRHGVQTGLDDAVIIDRVVKRHGCRAGMVTLQERHLAQAFQEVFFEKVNLDQRIDKLTEIFGSAPMAQPDDTVGIQNEIRSHLMKAGKPCFAAEIFVTLAEAQELIGELGGIACYPVLADGSKHRCEYETPIGSLIDNLKAGGYTMVEFIPIRNQPDVLNLYVTELRKAGFVIVAGTEHNTLDLLPIEPACANDQAIPRDVQDIFLEGICVLAAHQFLCAQGEPGFAQRYNDPACRDKEALIREFKNIGIVVLNRYFREYKN